MCKVKIHLFELSAMFGFICTSADRLSFQENNFLFRGCPRAPLPTHAVRRAGLNTSEFESSEGGLSNSNCGENFGSIDVWQATVRAKIAASARCARSLSDRGGRPLSQYATPAPLGELRATLDCLDLSAAEA